jgi:hypothetical protein
MRDLDRPVTVRIRLDRQKDRDVFCQRPSDRPQILDESVEIDVDPRG